jgi:hypothetical protein
MKMHQKRIKAAERGNGRDDVMYNRGNSFGTLNQKPKLAVDAFGCSFVAKSATNADNSAFESLNDQLSNEYDQLSNEYDQLSKLSYCLSFVV